VNTADTALPISGLEQMEDGDRAAIAATVTRMFTGFATRDAELLREVYTDDADWINAFGTVRRGRDDIVTYLHGLFADPNFDDGRVVALPECSLRRLDRDNALVHAHLQIEGQGLVGGGTIPLRDNHSLRVIARQSDNTWRIVSEMFSDVRSDQSYINHS
jgi:uncharacterized protein (TIGR02246 family)